MSMVFMQFSIYFLEHRDQAGESYVLDIDPRDYRDNSKNQPESSLNSPPPP